MGVYHPHAQYHHIKKENIGLIEVMGLAVLPARLKNELELLAEYILEGKDPAENQTLEKHADWVKEFLPKYKNITKENNGIPFFRRNAVVSFSLFYCYQQL